MYTILMVTTTTIIATAILVITFMHKANEKQITKDDALSEEDKERKLTKNEQRTCRMFTVCAILAGIFMMTSGTTANMRELSLSSKKAWHTIYENDIGAHVTIKQENSPWKTNEIDVTKTVEQSDIETLYRPFLFFNMDTATLKITASNNRDTTTREAEMPKENLIEKWPKGTKPDKKTGRIVKVEYRKIERPLKWFGMVVDSETIPEARVAIEYDARKEPKEPSTKTLFGEN